MRPIPLQELRSIIVFRTDHIGDLIVSTPFLRALREAAPQAQLTAVVPPNACEVLSGNLHLDRVLTLPQWTAAHAGPAPDLAIALSPRTATYKLASATQATYRAAYYYPERLLTRIACHFWLTHAFPMPIRKWLDGGRKVPHEIEQQALFAQSLGFEVKDKAPQLPISPEDLEWGRLQAPDRLALHLSPNWFSSGWSADDLAEVCQNLPPCLITHGPAETGWAAQLSATPGWTLPTFGDLSLARWAALLAAAPALISTDTGAVHIAAAHNRPVIIVYKPEQYQLCRQQWYPWGVPHRAIVKTTPAETLAKIQKALGELGLDRGKKS